MKKYEVASREILMSTWIKSDLDTLQALWPWGTLEEIKKAFPNRSQQALRVQAHKLKLKRNWRAGRRAWKPDEDCKLQSMYPLAEVEELQSVFNDRSWDAIKIRAEKLGIERLNLPDYRMADLSVLLKDEPQSMYWVGFILADGSFSNENRLRFHLAQKDMSQVVRFSRYINYTGRLQKPDISVMDSHNVPLLLKKFDIKPRKTYNPPDPLVYDQLPSDLWISLFIGFIDGDGCISNMRENANSIRIKLHSSWLGMLNSFSMRLSRELVSDTKPAKINNQGYAQWSTGRRDIMLKLKRATKKLPVLKRKWSRIND